MRYVIHLNLANDSFKCDSECRPMPNVMAALPNIGGGRPLRKFGNSIRCTTPQSLAEARRCNAVQ